MRPPAEENMVENSDTGCLALEVHFQVFKMNLQFFGSPFEVFKAKSQILQVNFQNLSSHSEDIKVNFQRQQSNVLMSSPIFLIWRPHLRELPE